MKTISDSIPFSENVPLEENESIESGEHDAMWLRNVAKQKKNQGIF